MLEKWKLIGKILDNKNFSIADIKVAYWLLDHRNYKTKLMYPTNRRLAKLSQLTIRQVQYSTAKLHRYNLVSKVLIRGKNHYELTMDKFKNYEQTFADKKNTTNNLSPPTKPTISIYNTIKKLSKNTNPYYKQVVNNGLSYHQNMENKYIRLMSKKLSQHRYNEWLEQVANKDTKQDALSYAKHLCG